MNTRIASVRVTPQRYLQFTMHCSNRYGPGGAGEVGTGFERRGGKLPSMSDDSVAATFCVKRHLRDGQTYGQGDTSLRPFVGPSLI